MTRRLVEEAIWRVILRPVAFFILAGSASSLAGALTTATPAAEAGQTRPGMRLTASALRAQFLEMAARSYFPGRTGQLVIVPREGHIMTRPDPDVPYMHGSPWPYDVEIPMFFVGSAVQPGTHKMAALQQDVSVTLAAAVGARMPPTATGRVLPVLRSNARHPHAVVLIVLDGMRRDYFDRYATEMPTLMGLRRRSAWFTAAQVNYLPTNTGVAHATLATGTDPRIHGITGNNLFDRVARKRYDILEGWRPRDLTALTLADVWQLDTRGRAVVLAQGSSVPAATALGGHGACQLNGVPVVLAGYDQNTGRWNSNAECFTLPEEIKGMDAKTLWPADGLWMGHKVDSPAGVRRSGLFPRFEADAMVQLIAQSSLGEDDVSDLIMLNYKAADYVGHKHGPHSQELRATLKEMDRHFARILSALEAKVGKDYLLAITGDHGMPPEPATPDHRHLSTAVVDLLHDRFDAESRQLVTYYEPENAQIFVDLERLATLKASLNDLARFLEQQSFVFAVFTEDEVRRAAVKLR